MKRLDFLAALVAVAAVSFLACSDDPLDGAIPQTGGTSTTTSEFKFEAGTLNSAASNSSSTTTTTTEPERVVPATAAPATSAELPEPTTTAPPPTVAAARTGACGGWRDLVASYFPAGQVATACRILMCESNGNPTARNPSSSAAGLYQFLLSTHKAYGEYPTYPTAADAPPASQVAAAARLYRARGWQPWVCA